MQPPGAAGVLGQSKSPLPLSNGLTTQSSAWLDPVFTSTPLRHARQPASHTGPFVQVQAASGLLSSQTGPANIWQQHSAREGAMSPSLPGPGSHAGSVVSSYLPHQQSGRSWSGSVQSLPPPTPQSAHQAHSGSLNDNLERRPSGNGLDMLQSAQGTAPSELGYPCLCPHVVICCLATTHNACCSCYYCTDCSIRV